MYLLQSLKDAASPYHKTCSTEAADKEVGPDTGPESEKAENMEGLF